MELTKKDIESIARLARLRLEEDEYEPLLEDLKKMFAFVDRLQAEDVEGIPPTAQVTGLENSVRLDEFDPCERREDLLNEAPRRERDIIEVRSVK